MGLFGKSKKEHIVKLQKQVDYLEKKTCSAEHQTLVDYILAGVATGEFENISATQAISFYKNISALRHAVGMITENLATIEPKIKDTSKDIFLEKHPVLDLLGKPNVVETYYALISKLTISYLVTGDMYVNSTGQVLRPPLELYSIPSSSIKIKLNVKDGFPESYQVQPTNTPSIFYRNDVKGLFRYYTKDGSSELYHARYANPDESSDGFKGLSKVQSIFYELEQHNIGNVYNTSLLKRGGRPSVIYSSAHSLSPDQRDTFLEYIKEFHAGERNAGEDLLLEGDMKADVVSITNKDMDFANLRQVVTDTIYRMFNIPLALVSKDTMTYNNLEVARMELYDQAVLPAATRIFEELTQLLMPRYPNSENLIITYDESEVNALEPRRNDEIAKKSALGVLSVNEQRALIGYDSIEGGDIIYGSAAEIPIGSVSEEKKHFVNILKKQIDDKGVRLHSDDDISKLVKKHYGE